MKALILAAGKGTRLTKLEDSLICRRCWPSSSESVEKRSVEIGPSAVAVSPLGPTKSTCPCCVVYCRKYDVEVDLVTDAMIERMSFAEQVRSHM